MRTVIRTMLAAAAGAALIAGGTTVVRLSEPAFAAGSPVASEPTARPGLVPEVSADAPEIAAPTIVEQDQEQADERPEPIRRSEPVPRTPSRSAPATDEPAPVLVDPPTVAPVPVVAADPTVRRVPVEREVRDEQEDQHPPDQDAPDPTADEDREPDRPSLLGRLTEPLGVTCGGLLQRVCG